MCKRTFSYPHSRARLVTLLRQYIPDSIACRLYLLTVLVETAIDLAIEGDIFLRFHAADSSDSQDMATRRMPVYLAIFAMAQYVASPLYPHSPD